MGGWSDAASAPEGVSVLVRGPFGIPVAQYAQGAFWAVAGKSDAYTEDGDLLLLEGVNGWMTLPQG
jgi:hypothetical protein